MSTRVSVVDRTFYEQVALVGSRHEHFGSQRP